MNEFVVYSDGSGTTGGPAGIAFVALERGEVFVERALPIQSATNQQAEILAAAYALHSLPEGSTVLVQSDSKYLVTYSSWALEWRKNGWRKKTRGAVANVAYWERLLAAISRHRDVQFEWVRGHNGNEWNERADVLAGEARATAKALFDGIVPLVPR